MKIDIQSFVNVSTKEVWEFYTNPEHIVNWNFASPNWHCPSAQNDLRPGGKYSARMEAKDGSFGFDFEAVYDTVYPLEGFTYTMEDGRQVDTQFIEEETGTLIKVSFDPEGQNSLELQRAGWQAILNNFTSYAESIASKG
ncbi:SRPBCC family protein [Leadbetterella byssophila]|uniref:Activator of Hsp90 ATPase 1 family protein n=1 Tax=Leadbetterella byssophila (strain DSM 17132 / JCM 16389 / KACC 11308 / NBRC 106382 / 4M15) TaxID=649349 RepID=E4RVZ7_LEAB4|nr:SRPBCC domain-containing protein [Leadbetterella byssophila]ADQ18907.1 Activator of Hsp90 ATPase 1 family protein [Leadbetterella byssophila DSM 17132]